MKKITVKAYCKKLLLVLAMLTLFAGALPVYANVSEVPSATAAAAIKDGWKKENVGYCYYKAGKKLTSQWLTIGKSKYYLGTNGARKTGWYTIKSKSYYFDSKGVYQKSKSIDKTLVSMMDKIIKGQGITDNTDEKAALKKLFAYVQNNYGYARVMGFQAPKGWEYTFAKEMLAQKRGSCYHYAAAFAFLAKRATGAPVRICWGTSNAFNTAKWQAHAWVEIKLDGTWYTYDANAAKFSSLRKGKWYQQRYSVMEGKIYKTQKTVTVGL